jgi:hypothetical protein
MDWEPLLKDLVTRLESGTVGQGLEREEHFERDFVLPIVRRCVADNIAHEILGIASHPWTKPDTKRPFTDEHRAAQKSWAACKEWANATGWGMTHTLDVFVWDKTSEDHECIAIEVKMCRSNRGKMPTGEFQRMIGQSALFLGQDNHKAVVAVFGMKGTAPRDLHDNEMADALRKRDIWPVILRVP